MYMRTVWAAMSTNNGQRLLPGTALFASAAPALFCLLSVSDSTTAAGYAAESSSSPI